jgi:hypothetical protein
MEDPVHTQIVAWPLNHPTSLKIALDDLACSLSVTIRRLDGDSSTQGPIFALEDEQADDGVHGYAALISALTSAGLNVYALARAGSEVLGREEHYPSRGRPLARNIDGELIPVINYRSFADWPSDMTNENLGKEIRRLRDPIELPNPVLALLPDSHPAVLAFRDS